MVAVNFPEEVFQVTALEWLRSLESQLSPELCRISAALDSMHPPAAFDAFKVAACVAGAMDAFRRSGAFKDA